MRDLLVVRPVDAGRLVGGGSVPSRLLVEKTRRAEIQRRVERQLHKVLGYISERALGFFFFFWGGVKQHRHREHIDDGGERVEGNGCQRLSRHPAQQVGISQN